MVVTRTAVKDANGKLTVKNTIVKGGGALVTISGETINIADSKIQDVVNNNADEVGTSVTADQVAIDTEKIGLIKQFKMGVFGQVGY